MTAEPGPTLAVVSPSGKIHAVRLHAKATVCGLDYTKRSRRSARRFLGWVSAKSSFETFAGRQQNACLNCVEGLLIGTGPHA